MVLHSDHPDRALALLNLAKHMASRLFLAAQANTTQPVVGETPDNTTPIGCLPAAATSTASIKLITQSQTEPLRFQSLLLQQLSNGASGDAAPQANCQQTVQGCHVPSQGSSRATCDADRECILTFVFRAARGRNVHSKNLNDVTS